MVFLLPTIKKSYEITDAKISFVSLVNKAANKRKFLITKGDDGTAEVQSYGSILKADNDTHYITGIVYEPMTADTDDEFMSAEEIAKAEKYFTENQGKIDEKHSFRPTEGLSVVDSWIQKCDCTIEGNVIKAGTWLMTVKCDNDKVWDKVQKGEYTGFSMGGKGIFSSVDVPLEKSEEEEPEKESLFVKFAKALGYDVRKVSTAQQTQDETKAQTTDNTEIQEEEDKKKKKSEPKKKEEEEVTKSELKAMLEENNQAIIKATKEEIKKAFEDGEINKSENDADDDKSVRKEELQEMFKEQRKQISKTVKEEIKSYQSKRGFAKNINEEDEDDIEKSDDECYLHGYL